MSTPHPAIDFPTVRAAVSLAAVLQLLGFQPASRRGAQQRGPCPLHGSTRGGARWFSAHLEQHLFHCFKGGKGGNALLPLGRPSSKEFFASSGGSPFLAEVGPFCLLITSSDQVIADKAYDSDALIAQIETQGATPVLPPRANRNEPRDYDRDEYKKRNVVERFINVLKQSRRVATRSDKTARNFLGFVLFVSTRVVLS